MFVAQQTTKQNNSVLLTSLTEPSGGRAGEFLQKKLGLRPHPRRVKGLTRPGLCNKQPGPSPISIVCGENYHVTYHWCICPRVRDPSLNLGSPVILVNEDAQGRPPLVLRTFQIPNSNTGGATGSNTPTLIRSTTDLTSNRELRGLRTNTDHSATHSMHVNNV